MNGCKGSEDIEIPGTVPVMVLEGATLFPRTLMPLYIFEPRYRAMLEEALATDRLVAIAQPLKGGGDQLCAVAGVGLIRACVKKEDGTSQLILQGVKRVSFTHWPQMLPFRIGAVQCFGRIESETQEQRNARLVHLQVILERGGLPVPGEMGEQLAKIDDPDVLTDIAASALLKPADQRQAVLQEEGNIARQDLLLNFLRKNLS